KNSLGKGLLGYFPYLLPVGYFVYWRMFIFVSKRVATDSTVLIEKYKEAPLEQFIQLAYRILEGFIQSSIFSFITPLRLGISQTSWFDLIGASLLALLSCAIFFLSLGAIIKTHSQKINSQEQKQTAFHWELILLGVLMAISGIIPLVMADRQVSFQADYSRYTLPAIPGVVFLIGGIFSFLEKIMKHRKLHVFFATIILFVSVMTHYLNGAHFGNVWDMQKDVWWQLSWRVPQIEDETILMVMTPENTRFVEGFGVFAPVSLIYYPPPVNELSIFAEVINQTTVEYVIEQKVFERYTRTIPIQYDYNNVLVISKPGPESCVHIYDQDFLLLSSSEGDYIRNIAPFSNMDRIILDEPVKIPDTTLFGKEQIDNWCYFYQKAELAKQKEDWEEIIRLGEEAESMRLEPSDGSEWMPFYIAYLKTNQEELAHDIQMKLIADQGFLDSLCKQKNNPKPIEDKTGQRVLDELCQ
ncbi:MAG: hypothetical protein JEZ06_01740, partial [Anaerolineaceae bacterium]|nr:hypothetical protein [Anaerolineaceae bacterium]